jgi:hypothetical protein
MGGLVSGFDEMLASLRALERLPEDAAKAAAPLIEAALRASAAKEESPDGKAWAPRKRGSGSVYAHAASHIKAQAIGTLVRVTLSGPEVFGHYGTGRLPRRPMLPDPGTLPASVARELERAAGAAFAKAVG